MSHIHRFAAGFSLFLLLSCFAAPVYSQSTDSTNALTTTQLLDLSGGTRVKLVWARFLNKGDPTDQIGPNHALVVFDTYEKKERVLQATPGAYDYPIITRDGTRVIWNDMANAESWICNWDGTGKTRLLKGDTISRAAHIASCRWDSVEKKEYVYAGLADANQAGCDIGSCGDIPNQYMYSYPLAGLAVDTTQRKVVWDGTKGADGVCAANYFQVSADGLFASGQMTGGTNCLGYVDLTLQTIVETRLSGAGPLGCRPNGAPDNSRRWFHLMAGHSWIHMYQYGGTDNSMWVRPDSCYPGMGAWSYGGLECPRWSNHPRFITGGASMGFASDPNTPYNGAVSFRWQFYLERFDAGFTKIEKIVQVSHAVPYYSEYSGQAWFDMGGASGVHSDHFSPSIGRTNRAVQEGIAYDIQGRTIRTRSDQMRRQPSAESRGVYIEQGQLRLIAR